MNPFAFVRAVRKMFDGPIVMAGGMSDGHALWAAQVLGCDLGYMGTKFAAARESMASDKYRELLVEAELDDTILTRYFTGLRTNMLTKSVIAAGIDLNKLDEAIDEAEARRQFGVQNAEGRRRWVDIFSAGHSVSGVTAVQSVAQIVAETVAEYEAAQRDTALTLAS
jgi:nitronate monooxygenase